MGFRFWRRIKIAPGVTVNLSKSGGSLSLGPRGAKFTVSRRGNRATVGIPGTGLFFTSGTPGTGGGRAGRATHSRPAARGIGSEERLSLGFFQRLVTPGEERALVDGCRELAAGRPTRALEHLEKAVHLADGAYLAGFLALREERLPEAAEYLARAADDHERLGRCFSKYGISAVMSVPITDEVTAHLGPDLRGVLLGQVEVYQLQERSEEAIACLERLRRLEPADVVVKLSLAELLLLARPGAKIFRRVVRLAEGVTNEMPVHAALLLYKARALRGLGLPVAARDTLTAALRRKRDRPEELLRALRYERALVYEDLGSHRRSHGELEKLYADAPDYKDVAARLGL